jgi:hypothetical protein
MVLPEGEHAALEGMVVLPGLGGGGGGREHCKNGWQAESSLWLEDKIL